MLTINRFDANTASSARHLSTSDPAAPTSSRLVALAQRKRKRLLGEEDNDSMETPGYTTPNISAENGSAAPSIAPTVSAPFRNPNIHPSRLAAAPLLARSVKKAMTAAGVPKDKTKAKQRYVKKKNQRRRAKLKAAAASQLKRDPAEEDAKKVDSGSNDDSDSGSESQSEFGQPKQLPSRHQYVENSPHKATIPPTADSSSSSSDSSITVSDSKSDSALDADKNAGTDARVQTTGSPFASPSLSIVDGKGKSAYQLDFFEPLERIRIPELESAEALWSLTAQGLPRGLALPRVVDARVRGVIDTSGVRNEAVVEENSLAVPPIGVDLDPFIKKRLKDLGIFEWFAVQAAVIPHLLKAPLTPSPFAPLRDLCVSAPTGSGKTLAYLIPIVSHLKVRVVTRLRALIILPTRDLVAQVRESHEVLAKGTGLRIGSVTGAQSFAQEQSAIVEETSRESRLDILISTPGRLIDHLDETRGFTLEHLRFLVIDEVDRLLGQSFQNWAQRLRSSLECTRVLDSEAGTGSWAASTARQLKLTAPRCSAAYDPRQPEPLVQKLLFSATLTREPGKLAELGLRDPVFIDVRDEVNSQGTAAGEKANATMAGGRYSLPATLREHMLVVPTALKPLHLIHLLLRGDETKEVAGAAMERTLVFTKSVDSAFRLVKLLDLFFQRFPEGDLRRRYGPGVRRPRVADYSSDLSAGRRRALLKSFTVGDVDVVVASDLISRGIDLPLVENVVSYDVPVDAAKYVHRVGRTARANRLGNSWSLVEEQEARFFKRMLRDELSRLDRVKKVRIKEDELTALRPAYDEALQELVASFAPRKRDEQ